MATNKFPMPNFAGSDIAVPRSDAGGEAYRGSPPPVTILHNPTAGSGNRGALIDDLINILSQRGIAAVATSDLVEVANAASSGVPDRLATDDRCSQNPQVTGIIVAAGGDGTLTLASQIAAASGAAVLPMPMGTENLLARQMGYSAVPAVVAESILKCQIRSIDSIDVRIGRRQISSLVMATAGFDAAVVRRVHLRRRGHIRRWTYAGPIARSMVDYPFSEIRVIADHGEPIICRWAMVFNGPAYAGSLPIAPAARIDDGKLDVVCFTGKTRLDGLRYLAGVMTGRHHRFSDVQTLQAVTVRIESDARVPLQCDGDYVGRLPATLQCRPGSVRLVRPAS